MQEKTSDNIDLYSLKETKYKAFWALDQLENTDSDRFSASQIANFLIEDKKIKTSRQAIEFALKKAGRSIHKNKNGYKLMDFGIKELKSTKNQESVIFIESEKPFTAKNIKLKKLFEAFRGDILISDPYIDINTLDIIFKNFQKKNKIKILTNQFKDKPSGVFIRHLNDLRSEGYKIEVAVYSNSILHDRYLIDDKSFWLSGNSFNFLGSKESFIVSLGEDIRTTMLATFQHRWKVATKL